MNLSMKWLREYVDIHVSPKQFATDMTMTGSKVEGYHDEGEEISNVVVGKIISIVKHPNADSLVICQVNVGEEENIQIVTGATNLYAGAIVPVALHGSTLPNGVTIRKGKLRGEVSNGMLCSLGELNLTQNDFPSADANGIMIIDEPCTLGQDIKEALGLNDISVEFEITPNRPDCLSMIGLAREVSATYHLPLTVKQPVVTGSGGNIHELLQVDVKSPALCPRYIAKMVKNVKIAPSPRWMRERLRACGIRPINNIVDITNYVLLEYGQPMHAFDYRYVQGHKIVVRNATPEETIVTLDKELRKLTEDMLVVADEKSPSAIAGVMGGEFSSIMDDTSMIVFESANFLGSSVRKTSRKLGLRTESSGKFEKGLDSDNTLPAVLRACELVELLQAGEVIDGIIDVDNSSKKTTTLPLDANWINKFLGTDIPQTDMIRILEELQFTVKDGIITVPHFREDVEHKTDIAEEIARMYGYNNIPTHELKGSAKATLTSTQKFEREISTCLYAQGLNDIITYSFLSPKVYDKIALPLQDSLRNSVVISNPLGEDTSIMRTTALPSMLEVLSRNYNSRNSQAALYEIATVYHPTETEQLPLERKILTIGMYGETTTFYTLKSILESLCLKVGCSSVECRAYTIHPSLHPGRAAELVVNETVVGYLGEVHPIVCENYEIATRAYVAMIALDTLYPLCTAEKRYQPLPKFPSTQRDLALLCDDSIPVIQLEKSIKSAIGAIMEKVELFDIYKGAQIPEGKKSVAFNITLRANDHTLTVEEIDGVVQKALKSLENIGATLRG